MSLKFVLPLAFAVACLPLAGTLFADTYTETGDAADLPAGAQIVTGAAGTPLTSISGQLTATNAVYDSDMFEIFISSPSTFSAATTGFVPGANNFDSQIFLFSAAGKGIIANDDAASGGDQSSIDAGSFTGAAGAYYLLISGSGRYPTSAGGLIFPNFTDGTTDPSTTVGPTGPGGGSAITGYTGTSNEGGNYRIALAGAQFVPPGAVPEPSATATVIASLVGLALLLRRRRLA